MKTTASSNCALKIGEAATRFREAANAKKCLPCGCLHGSIDAAERAFLPGEMPTELASAIREARARLVTVRYDCLGCSVCFPAIATNALGEAGVEIADNCPADRVEVREGWPPLPGDHVALRYQAPVAICSLTDHILAEALARRADPEVSIIGTLQTENLGIERIIQNVISNPSIRFLILCGADSRQRIGHLPGASLVALARAGIDERSRINGAPGKRPVLINVSPNAVEHFRRTVETIDLIGCENIDEILELARQCAERDPGPAADFEAMATVPVMTGHLPERMIPDPAGYFVVYADREKRCLSLEHFRKEGVLDAVIAGATAAEVYTPAVEQGLVSRLDHAAYLGRELARAEESIREGKSYVQDGAPERETMFGAANSDTTGCGCHAACEGGA